METDGMTTAHEVRSVFIRYPELGQFGFGTQPPTLNSDFLEQVDTVRNWIVETPDRSRTLTRRGSYAIKHMIEQAVGRYIPNGAMIAGALLEGYAPVRRYPGPNAIFLLPHRLSNK